MNLRMIALCAALVSIWTGCAPALMVRRDVSVLEQAAGAERLLARPKTAPAGAMRLTWLCLLRGHGCDSLMDHAARARLGTHQQGLAQLAYALALQREGSGGQRRAKAWLDLGMWAAHNKDHQDLLLALSLMGLRQLWGQDPSATDAAIAHHPVDRERLSRWPTQVAHPEFRRWAYDAVVGLGLRPSSPLGRPPQRLRLATTPSTQRVHLGLLHRPALGRSVVVPVHRDAALWTAEVSPSAGPGVYAVALEPPGDGPPAQGLWISSTTRGSVWSGQDRTPLRRGADPLWLAWAGGQPVTLTLALSEASERISVAWGTDTRASSPAGQPGLLAVVSRLALRTDKRWDGPLGALVQLVRGARLGQEAADRLLALLPGHPEAVVTRAALARDNGQPHFAQRLMAGIRSRHGSTKGRLDFLLEEARQRQHDGLGDLAAAALAAGLTAHDRLDCGRWRHYADVTIDLQSRPLARHLLRYPACRLRHVVLWGELMALTGRSPWRFWREQLKRPLWRARVARRARRLSQHDPSLAPFAWQGAPRRDSAERLLNAAAALEHPADRSKALGRLLWGPHVPMELRRRAWSIGAAPPWRGLEVDGVQWVSQHRQPSRADIGVTWLLDHEILVALPGGGFLRRVHQILQVHTSSAAEQVGEIAVPVNAELVLARTHTPAGAVLSPADTPDKSSISLRGVAPGAAVEYVQLQFIRAQDAVNGSTRPPPFVFGSPDGWTLESRYEVLDKATQGATAEASPGAPKMTSLGHGAWRLRRWRSEKTPPFVRETRTPRLTWQLPAVRVSQGASEDSVVGPLEDALAAHLLKPTGSLRPWVKRGRAAAGEVSRWRATVEALFAAVAHRRRGTSPGDPWATLRTGTGDRASLLYQIAHRAGVKACLVRVVPPARQFRGAEFKWAGLHPEDFSASAVVLQLSDGGAKARPVWVDPGQGLFDQLRASLAGQPAVWLGCGKEAETVGLTPRGGVPYQRAVDIELDWRADGSVVGQVRERLGGGLAPLVRHLARTRPQRLPVLLGGRAFKGMRLSWQRGSLQPRPNGEVSLTYSVSAAPSKARAKTLELGLMPYALARSSFVQPARRRPMLLSLDLDLQVKLTVHTGREPAQADVAAPLESPHLSFSQTLERPAPLSLRLTHQVKVRGGHVSVEEYLRDAAAARAIGRAEQITLTR